MRFNRVHKKKAIPYHVPTHLQDYPYKDSQEQNEKFCSMKHLRNTNALKNPFITQLYK